MVGCTVCGSRGTVRHLDKKAANSPSRSKDDDDDDDDDEEEEDEWGDPPSKTDWVGEDARLVV